MYSPPDPPNLISGLVRTLRGSELTSTVDPVPKPLCKKIGIWSPKRVFLKLIQLYISDANNISIKKCTKLIVSFFALNFLHFFLLKIYAAALFGGF